LLINSSSYSKASIQLQQAGKLAGISSCKAEKWYKVLETMCILKTKNVVDIIKTFSVLVESDFSHLHGSIGICYYYYSLAMHYYSLRDYKESFNAAKVGLDCFSTKLDYDLFTATEERHLVEALFTKQKIDHLLKRVMYDSQYRPQPDGVCRYEDCYSCNVHDYINSERPIYRDTDIDYKGYVTLICKEKCKVDFHMVCWREFKSTNTIIADRNFLGLNCRTPDCLSYIEKIKISKRNGQTKILEN